MTENIHNLESRLLEDLHLCTELPNMTDYVRRTKKEILEVEPVNPEEKAIDAALQRCWVILRNLESWMRVVEALGRKEKCNLRTLEELKPLTEACMHDCHSQRVSHTIIIQYFFCFFVTVCQYIWAFSRCFQHDVMIKPVSNRRTWHMLERPLRTTTGLLRGPYPSFTMLKLPFCQHLEGFWTVPRNKERPRRLSPPSRMSCRPTSAI